MRSRLVALVLCAASLVGPGVVLAWDDSSPDAAAEATMTALIDDARTSESLSHLTFSASLDAAAGDWARTMAETGHLTLGDPGPCADGVVGSTTYPDDVATQQMFDSFMRSSSNRGTLLTRDATQIGVGSFKAGEAKYWAVFLTIPCPTATPKPTPKPTSKPTVTLKPATTPVPVRSPSQAASTPPATLMPTGAPTASPTPDVTSSAAPVLTLPPLPSASPIPVELAVVPQQRPTPPPDLLVWATLVLTWLTLIVIWRSHVTGRRHRGAVE